MYKITHFARQSPENNDSWIMVGYITKDERGVFRFGVEDVRHFTEQEIQNRVSNGPLIKIEPQVDFDPAHEALWLQGPEDSAKVWLASRQSPMSDVGKKLVWTGALFAPKS